MEKEQCIIQMEKLNMKVIGLMIKQKEMEKIILEDGKYNIGQYKNGLRNGKGTMYYANGKIKYKGDWIDDKFIEN